MKKIIILVLITLSATSIGASFSTNSTGTSTVVNTGYTMGRAGAPVTITQNIDTSTIHSYPFSLICTGGGESHLRRFDLDGDHAISEALNVTSLDIGIQNVVSPQTLSINLYSIANSDPFLLANLTPIGTASLAVTSADDISMVNAAITGTLNGATHDLVVEVFSNDPGNNFYIGANDAGEIADSYIFASVCSVNEPTTLASLGYPNVHILMVVNGELDEITGAPVVMVPTLSWYSLFALMFVLLVFGRNFIKNK